MSLTSREEIEKKFAEMNTAGEDDQAPEGEPIVTPLAETEPVIETPEPPAAAPTVDPMAEFREEQRKAEARLSSMQGMVEKYKRDVDELKAKQPLVAPNDHGDEPDTDPDFALLVEEYGEPAANAMKNLTGKALAAAKKETESVREELQQTKEATGKLVEAASVTAEETYYKNLEKEVPGWKKINGSVTEGIPQDPKFTEMLRQKVPFQDYTYNDLLVHHHTQGNVAKVVEIFKAASVQSTETVAPPVNPLEMLIEPDKTHKGTPPPVPPGQKKIFTRAEADRIKQDFTDFQAGRLKADPVKIKAKLDQVLEALQEDRVR